MKSLCYKHRTRDKLKHVINGLRPIYIFVSVRPALSWLVSSIGRERSRGQRSRVRIPYFPASRGLSRERPLLAGKSRINLIFFFPGFLFANVTATQVNSDDLLSFACIYIHNLIVQVMHYKCNSKFNSMCTLIRFSDTFHLASFRNIFYSRSYAPRDISPLPPFISPPRTPCEVIY